MVAGSIRPGDIQEKIIVLKIKNAGVEDIPLLQKLALQVWPQTYMPILGREQVSYMLEMMYGTEALDKQITGGQTFLLCYDDEVPVGFASFSKVNDTVKLHKLYILPEQQGNGVGRFMLRYISMECKKLNVPWLELNVNRYNNPAKAFYEQIGFTVLKEEDIDIGGGYFMNDYVLRLAV